MGNAGKLSACSWFGKVSKFLLDQSKQVLDSFHGKKNHSLLLLCKWRRNTCLSSTWRSRITRCLITTVQIENYCSCRYIFCNGLHKNRFTVAISRTQLATSNKNVCRINCTKAIYRGFNRVFISRFDKIPKTLLSSLASFCDCLQKLMKSSCSTRRLEKINKAVVEKI